MHDELLTMAYIATDDCTEIKRQEVKAKRPDFITWQILHDTDIGSASQISSNIERKKKKREITPLGVITGASRPKGSPRLLS